MEKTQQRIRGRVTGLVLDSIGLLARGFAKPLASADRVTNRLKVRHGHRNPRAVVSLLVVLLVCSVSTRMATARQACSPGWLPGSGVPGVNGDVNAMVMWDPDGAGPQEALLVAGGRFTVAGDVLAGSVATWNPATGSWAALGSFPGYAMVNALAVLPSGELIAGGFFRGTTGYDAFGIARWRGGAWRLVDEGPAGTVHALAVLPTGGVVAAGQFDDAGTTLLGNIARWDGTETGAWLPMGAGLAASLEDEVYALVVLPSGEVVAGGDFSVVGPVFSTNVARWDGVVWSALGQGVTGIVYSLAALPNGNLAAGGSIVRVGDIFVGGIARWNGSTWSAFASAAGLELKLGVRSIVGLAGGDMLVGGTLRFYGGASATGIARWSAANGGSWTVPGAGIGGTVLSALSMPDGGIIAAGYFTRAGNATVSNIARFDGGEPGTWATLSSGTNGDVCAFAVLPSGDLVAAGEFTSILSTPANHVAIMRGDIWSPLGLGIENPIAALAVLHGGDVAAASNRASLDPHVSGAVHRWTGSVWLPLGSQSNGRISVMAVLPNGDLIAAGGFTRMGDVAANNIARWDGVAWSPLGSGVTSPDGYGYVSALAVSPDGSLIVGGRFAHAGSIEAQTIARWNAATPGGWSPLGTEIFGGIESLLVLPNGDLIAGGDLYFRDSYYQYSIVRWDGIAWQWIRYSLGSDYPLKSLVVLPGGDLIAGGGFTFDLGRTHQGIARFAGTTWTEFNPTIDNNVRALAVMPNGDLVAGGSFSSAGNNASAHFARFPAGRSPPSIAIQPGSVFGCPSAALDLVVMASGTGPFTYRWRLQGVPVDLGANPTAGTAALVISNLQTGNAGVYDCIVSNACGSTASQTANVTIWLRADLVGGGYQGLNPDGVTDGSDFIAFINSFAVGDTSIDSLADIAGGGPDGRYPNGIIDSEDFIVFINAFVNGC